MQYDDIIADLQASEECIEHYFMPPPPPSCL